MIYEEAAWVLILFGSTALLREALGELCIHYIASIILRVDGVKCEGYILRSADLDSLLACSGGGHSLGFGASWKLRRFADFEPRIRIVRHVPLLCWAVGMPVKLVAVTAVRPSSALENQIFPAHLSWMPWALGIFWICLSVVVKMSAVYLSRRRVNYRRMFQEKFSRFHSYVEILKPELLLENGVGIASIDLALIIKSGHHDSVSISVEKVEPCHNHLRNGNEERLLGNV